MDHIHVCRPLLGGQTARVGETWSCTSPPAGVIQVTIQCRRCRLLLPMPTLLTACMGDRPCHGQAALGRNTSRGARKQALGRLPMRNGSRQGAVQQSDGANSCIYNIRHAVPGDERPSFPETFCGIVYRANSISLYVPHIKPVSPPLCFLQRSPYRLWYDGVAHAPSDRAPGREDTWWPAPMAPSERAAPTPCHAPASAAE